MYFVPLTQLESVELVLHSLRSAGGQGDCSACPAYRVCTHQCLTIADSIEKMLQDGALPRLAENDPQGEAPPEDDPDTPDGSAPGGRGRLKIVK